jgi:hypothetical protein
VSEVCNSIKIGEYDWLRCCRKKGHDGEHNYVVTREKEIVKIKELQDDIVALTARIKELEERIALLKGPSDQIYLDALARIKELEGKMKTMVVFEVNPDSEFAKETGQ